MDKILRDKVLLTVDNYREAKEYLRNDGDLINHFTALVFSHYDRGIEVERIKEIRKYIKSTTTRMSPFRGEALYIISILIASTFREGDEQRELIDNMYYYLEVLKEEGFESGVYLALTAYTMARYYRNKDKKEIVVRTKEVFIVLKEKYNNITSDDDYLICTLWALNNIEGDLVEDFVENVFEHVADSKIRSKNGIQGLANAIILNGSSGHMYRSMEFILQLQKRDIKLAHQFLPLIGMITDLSPRRTADLVQGVIEQLCEEESQYEYYIDKGFRTVIAIVLVQLSTLSEKRRYIDELLAHGILNFISSKNKGIFADVLS